MSVIHENNARIFKAFCDEKRLRILELLKDGELCTNDLMVKMEMPQSSLSYHMKILSDSGIIAGRGEGKWTYYYIDAEASAKAAELLLEITKKNEAAASVKKTAAKQKSVKNENQVIKEKSEKTDIVPGNKQIVPEPVKRGNRTVNTWLL